MAHFAELDENNVVTRVIVVANSDTADVNGVEKEHIGAAFCEKLFGGTWKQTSYNASFRKRYAGAGHTYRADIDAFVAPQPFPSWTLDENANWQPPVAMPTDTNEEGSPKYYSWNEETGAWNVVSMQGA
jgi:hypothetical protein